MGCRQSGGPVGLTWVDISPSMRTPNGVYAPLEDVEGPIDVGQVVKVRVPEGHLTGGGLVTSIDYELGFVYLSLAWDTLHDGWYRIANMKPALGVRDVVWRDESDGTRTLIAGDVVEISLVGLDDPPLKELDDGSA